ncbi:hypothetical protein Fmac_018502 [Flemingia macrophylla]|uniref:Uncharacterized protein n=1 Tax=Flemingia macrophylla TaxID=520843 RepID=A0ABD1M581_9FABA
MACLTPGVLSKLVENAGSKVTAPHRQALLQVTEIVPRLSPHSGLHSRGYFLKLSDSLHAAFVSVSDADADLICSDKLQLGQFVYVTRLDAAHPLPLVRGLNPLPRRRPCVGNPTLLLQPPFPTQHNPFAFSSSKSKTLSYHALAAPNSASSPYKLKSNKSSPSSPNVIDKKASVKAVSPLKTPTSRVSPLKNKNENLCPKSLTSIPSRKSTTTSATARSPSNGTVHSQLVKVPFNSKTWCYDTPACWEDLSPSLCDHGKQIVSHRNAAFLAAVRSLEEASATDTVIQCMWMYAELCQSSQTHSAGSIVKQFLELHLSLQRVTMVFDSLLAPLHETKPSNHLTLQSLTEDACKVPTRKNAISWVQAAIGTNLSKFNLYETQTETEVLNGEKFHYVVIENSSEDINTENSPVQNKQNRASQANHLPNSTAKRHPSSKRNHMAAKNKDAEKQDQSKQIELKEAASLAKKLLEASSEWFLNYLEGSLSNEFGMKNEGNIAIACLLGQLKQVNHWLDNLVGGDKVDNRVEKLRKKLYRFVLEHVNSAVASNQ